MERRCPVTGGYCAIGENLSDLERLASVGPERQYTAAGALGKLVSIQRYDGDCLGSWNDVNQQTNEIVAVHCGVDNASEIDKLASEVGRLFKLPEPKLYTSISSRRTDLRID